MLNRNKLVFSFLGIIACFEFSCYFLKNNFHQSGEAFFKGSGHLLSESPINAIVFFVFAYFLVPFFTFYFLNQSNSMYHFQNKLMVFWNLLMGVVFYFLGLKIYEMLTTDFDRHYGIVELVMRWVFPWLAFMLNYFFQRQKSKDIYSKRVI